MKSLHPERRKAMREYIVRRHFIRLENGEHEVADATYKTKEHAERIFNSWSIGGVYANMKMLGKALIEVDLQHGLTKTIATKWE